MELDKKHTGRLKNIEELDTVTETLTVYGGLKGFANNLRQEAEKQELIVDSGNLRLLAGPLEFGPKYRQVIIVNLRRAALGKKPAYGYESVSPEVADHARAMLEPFGLLESRHKRFFSRFVETSEVPPATAEN